MREKALTCLWHVLVHGAISASGTSTIVERSTWAVRWRVAEQERCAKPVTTREEARLGPATSTGDFAEAGAAAMAARRVYRSQPRAWQPPWRTGFSDWRVG